MTFNQSFGINALSVNGNNFSGPVPSWPDQPASLLTLRPGNEGVCGINGTVRAMLSNHLHPIFPGTYVCTCGCALRPSSCAAVLHLRLCLAPAP